MYIWIGFHSTLFQEAEYNENINKIGLVLKENMKIPFLVNIKDLYFKLVKYSKKINIDIANDYEKIYIEIINEEE